MKPILITIAMLILCSLTFGQNTNCPEQEYLTWDHLSVQIDPNQIAIHPETGEPLFLGAITVEVGTQWAYEGWACDPDGDAMAVTTSDGTIVTSAGYVYTVRGTETSIGIKYLNISATDVPTPPAAPITVTGTLVVVATPRNHGPILCGGRP